MHVCIISNAKRLVAHEGFQYELYVAKNADPLHLCRKCEGHDDAVRVLAVAGGKVFSGSYDGTIGVW